MTHPHRHPAPRALLTCALAALSLASAGCASRTPYLDSQFGQSVQQLRAQQTLNPKGVVASDAAGGIDAQAAKSAYDAYQKTYRAPEPQPSVFIGIGGNAGR